MLADIQDVIRKLPDKYGLCEMEATDVYLAILEALEWDSCIPDSDVDAWDELFGTVQTRQK